MLHLTGKGIFLDDYKGLGQSHFFRALPSAFAVVAHAGVNEKSR
jgi:hypothetical protein